MAKTKFAFADPRARIIWSKKLYPFILQDMFFTQIMGPGVGSVVTVEDRLTTEKGGTIVVKSRRPLTGSGQGDDGRVRGQSEAQQRLNMSILVHERAHSTESAGKLSEQLTDSMFREESLEDLGEWGREALEDDIVNTAAGLYNVNSSSNTIATINETAPTSDRIYRGGQSAAGALGNSGSSYTTDALMTAGTKTDNLFGTIIAERIHREMRAASPKFRKVAIRDIRKADPNDPQSFTHAPKIGDFYIVLYSSLQKKAVKAETGTNGWKTITKDAADKGVLNPIFTNASFIWDGMLFMEYDRIPSRTGAGGTTLAEGFTLNAGRTATTDPAASARTMDRALFLGEQAISFGWAQHPRWYEDFVERDIGTVEFDMIYGVKRTNFNEHGTTTPTSDYAIFVLDTEVVVDV